MNRVVLVGRLENTPELRHTSTGIPVANFSLSVRRSIPNGQGKYERDIFRVVTWRKLAETCCRFLERGRMIAVDGKLQNRILSAPSSDRRVVVEVHADDVRFLEGARPRTDNADETLDEKSGSSGNAGYNGSDLDAYEVPVAVAIETEENPDKPEYGDIDEKDHDDSRENSWLSEDDAGTPLDLNS